MSTNEDIVRQAKNTAHNNFKKCKPSSSDVTRANQEGKQLDLCISCSNIGFKYCKCANCRLVKYCSRQYQKDHWKAGHKGECNALKESCLSTQRKRQKKLKKYLSINVIPWHKPSSRMVYTVHPSKPLVNHGVFWNELMTGHCAYSRRIDDVPTLYFTNVD